MRCIKTIPYPELRLDTTIEMTASFKDYTVQNQTPMNISIKLLADQPHRIGAVGELRWREWGDTTQPDTLDRWVQISEEEAGYERLPVTWVVVDAHGQVVGAIGLPEFEIEEARDRSTWVVSVIEAAHQRSTGIAGQLMAVLEVFAHFSTYSQLWVATGVRAVTFYQKCGCKLS